MFTYVSTNGSTHALFQNLIYVHFHPLSKLLKNTTPDFLTYSPTLISSSLSSNYAVLLSFFLKPYITWLYSSATATVSFYFCSPL